MIDDYYFYLTAIPAVLVYGIGKGGFGGGLGVIAVPLIALTIPPFQAASILLPILCVMDIFAVKHHHRNCDYKELKMIFPYAFIGILIGSVIMGVVSDKVVEISIGAVSLLFCVQYYLVGPAKSSGKISCGIWSTLSGISSTMIHAGGGPISIYLLPKNLNKMVLVGTMAVLFAIMNLIKLIPYAYFGQFDSQNLLTSLVLLPLAPIGVKLGVYLLNIASQQQVYRICYFLLLLSGAKLLHSGLMG
ncbi:sulfite exporter TauE/SafE family protein [Vibrio neonatus]|uniref:sulfite exporter TauE/SafE family protein n=1 Tax=Vibrio neonatus TaxID=278860 RepID=UPI0021C2E26F|nr:sulfite exporter TauE/SafE family protein [Vibrio neonatus]